MAQTYDLTRGKTSSVILKFFFPMFFTNMLQQLYTVADTAIVGKGLGDNALASVGNMSSLTFLIIGFSLGISNGFSVSIAQSYGAGNHEKLKKAIAASVKLSVIVTIILTAISMLFLKPVLVMLRTDESILKDSLIYGYIIFGGLFSTIAYNMASCILRALGDSKTPFTAIIVSTIINIGLNCLFIFGMKTGVEGVAIATIIAQVVSALICFARLKKIEIIRLSSQDFKADFAMYSELFRNGLPMALMNSITAVGCMVIQYFINGLGVAYTSAYSACSKFINLFMQPACTAGFAMSSFTSQNYGAGQYYRIKEGLKACLGIAIVSYLLLGSVMFFFPEALAKIMLTGDEQIAIAAQYLPVSGIMLFAVDFLFVFRSGVQAMGRPFIPMISGIVEMAVRIVVTVSFISRTGFITTAYAEVLAWLAALLLNASAFVIYLRSKLEEKRGLNVEANTAINH